jgi:NUMOD3 motif
MSIYCPLSEALGIDFIPSEGSSYNSSQIAFDPSYMGNSGSLNPMYGKTHTEESKRLMREARLGKSSWNKGKSFGPETRQKMSEKKKDYVPWNKGKRNVQVAWNKGLKTGPMSEEIKKKKSHPLTNKREQVTCPHCQTVGDISAMKRWHFDKCRKRSI